MPDAPVQLKLDDDTRKEVDRLVIQMVRDGVAGSAQRDSDIADFDDQLEGRLQPSGTRWRNSCTLNDPLTQEVHLELLSLINQAFAKTPLCLVESTTPNEDDKATRVEGWLINKAAQYQLRRKLYDWAYNATGRDDTAILYCGWKQQIRKARRVLYRELNADGPDDMVEADQREADGKYEETAVQFDVVAEGCDIRVVDLGDLYLYPSNMQSIADAHAVGERILLTAHQLLDGVADFGYDDAAVDRLIARGPTHILDDEGDYRARQDAYDGTTGENTEPGDGLYECFLVFARLPSQATHKGASDYVIPEQYEHDDVMCMVCPAQDIVFQMDLSPYGERPYIGSSILPKPGRFLGKGGCRLLATLQDEANANLQSTIDSINIEMSPVLVASESWLSRFSNRFSIYPGAMLPDDDEQPGTGLRALQWQRNSTLGMELQSAIVSRGKGLASAEGYGELDPKQRKNGEIQNVMSAADSKFDLFLTNFMFGVEELFGRIVALHAQFDPEMDDVFAHNGKQQRVTADDLRSEFMFVPTATSTTTTPQMRLQLAQAVLQVQQSYLEAMQNTPPEFLPYVWHAHRAVLVDMGNRQPEAIIGPEPQAPPAVPPQFQQLIQQGVPLQTILQMLQGQGQQGGAGQMAAGPQAGPGPGANGAQGGVPAMFLQGGQAQAGGGQQRAA